MSKLSTLGSGDLLAGLAVSELGALHDFHDAHIIFYFPPIPHFCHLLSLGSEIEPGTHLYLVQHLPRTRYQDCMLQDEILILKFLPVDELAISATVAICKVTTLAYESRNKLVKGGAIPNKSFLFGVETALSARPGRLLLNRSSRAQAEGLWQCR